MSYRSAGKHKLVHLRRIITDLNHAKIFATSLVLYELIDATLKQAMLEYKLWEGTKVPGKRINTI